MEKAMLQYNVAEQMYNNAQKDFKEVELDVELASKAAARAAKVENNVRVRAGLIEAVRDHTEEVMKSKLKSLNSLKSEQVDNGWCYMVDAFGRGCVGGGI